MYEWNDPNKEAAYDAAFRLMPDDSEQLKTVATIVSVGGALAGGPAGWAALAGSLALHSKAGDGYGLATDVVGLMAQRAALAAKFTDDVADWFGIGASQTSELGRNGQ